MAEPFLHFVDAGVLPAEHPVSDAVTECVGRDIRRLSLPSTRCFRGTLASRTARLTMFFLTCSLVTDPPSQLTQTGSSESASRVDTYARKRTDGLVGEFDSGVAGWVIVRVGFLKWPREADDWVCLVQSEHSDFELNGFPDP